MLIAARNAMMVGKRLPTARDYVQNGLVNLIDGIENGGFGLHREGATTIYPIVDCITGAEYASNNVFCGTDGFETSLTYRMPAFDCGVYGLTEFTIEYVVLFGNTGNRDCSFIRATQGEKIYYPSLSQIGGTPNSGVSVRAGGYSDVVALTVDSSKSPIGCYAFFRMSSGANNFGCGCSGGALSKKTSTNTSYIFAMPNSNISFAADSQTDPNTGLKVGKLFGIRCYNRWLTDAEIAANYAVDKARFNLP